MEESKIRKMISDFFTEDNMDEESIDLIVQEIHRKKLTSILEIKKYLKWLQNEFTKRIIDDSEFDDDMRA